MTFRDNRGYTWLSFMRSKIVIVVFGEWVSSRFTWRQSKSVLLHKFSHSFNCFTAGFGSSGCNELFMSPSLWYHFLIHIFSRLRADFPELPYRVAQKHAVQNGELKKNHQMLTFIVLCRSFNSRNLWALGHTHDQRTIISNVTSNNPHQDGPQLWLFLFNVSHPEPITKVSIDRLFLLTVSLLNAVSYFGGCLWKDSCKQGTLINSAALEGGTGERRTFLTDGKSFSEARKLQRRKWFLGHRPCL